MSAMQAVMFAVAPNAASRGGPTTTPVGALQMATAAAVLSGAALCASTKRGIDTCQATQKGGTSGDATAGSHKRWGTEMQHRRGRPAVLMPLSTSCTRPRSGPHTSLIPTLFWSATSLLRQATLPFLGPSPVPPQPTQSTLRGAQTQSTKAKT
eukprot:349960-Chlamydomonas_euryale.AAC.2